jgi:heat shock protein HslJ
MTVDSARDAESPGPDLLPDHREALRPDAPGGDGGPEASTLTGDPRGWASAARADGGGSAVRRSVLRLQAQAGNAAVAALVGRRANGGGGRQRTGPVLRHAAGADVTDTQESLPATGPGSETPLEEPAQVPAAPVPTSSFTKVGPPTRSSYTVSGTLRQAAEAVAARPEAGATIVTPVMDMADNGTRPTHVQVTVSQAVELPDWDGKAAATQNQRNEWDRFKAAITTHENGHVATDVTSFANAHVKVKAKPTVAEGDTEWNRIVGQATTDNDAFDAGNDHGRSAGTKINPNIDEVTKVP